MNENLPEEFLALLRSVTAKRAKTVIDHILAHGYITTEELKDTYGYNHPPRAVRDVRELGIPIEMFRVEGGDGRKIAAYKFGEYIKEDIAKKATGRRVLSKQLKEALISKHGAKCFIYNEPMSERELQIDHRVPYEVGGDPEGEPNPDDFMLLSASANRMKSWSCEHCRNWQVEKYVSMCRRCYWAYPEDYDHIALRQMRRIDLMFQGDEVEYYEKLKEQAEHLDMPMQGFIKEIIRKHV